MLRKFARIEYSPKHGQVLLKLGYTNGLLCLSLCFDTEYYGICSIDMGCETEEDTLSIFDTFTLEQAEEFIEASGLKEGNFEIH